MEIIVVESQVSISSYTFLPSTRSLQSTYNTFLGIDATVYRRSLDRRSNQPNTATPIVTE